MSWGNIRNVVVMLFAICGAVAQVGCAVDASDTGVATRTQALRPGDNAAVMTSFTPDRGFLWANSGQLKSVWDSGWLDLSLHNGALCGGMAFTMLDYYYMGRAHAPNQWYPPANGTLLRKHLLNRQQTSITGDGNLGEWIALMVGGSKTENSLVNEYRHIVESIDAGHPVVIGASVRDQILVGHQIIIYGYDNNGYNWETGANKTAWRLFALDPNRPQEQLTLRYFAGTEEFNGYFGYDEDAGASNPKLYSAFFMERYKAHVAPSVADEPVYPAASADLIHELIIEFTNNGDDLQGGDDFISLDIYLTDGTKWHRQNISGGGEWDGDPERPGLEFARVLLPHPVHRDLLGRIDIIDNFGGGISGENWDVEDVKVYGLMGGSRTPVVNNSKFASGIARWIPKNVLPLDDKSKNGQRFVGGKPDPLTVLLHRPIGSVQTLEVDLSFPGPTDSGVYPSLKEMRAIVRYVDGTAYIAEDITRGADLMFGETSRTIDVHLNRPVEPCNIANISVIQTEDGQTRASSTEVRALVNRADGGTDSEVMGSHGPYMFEDRGRLEIDLATSIPCSGTPPVRQFLSQLQLRIETAGDDLRGGDDNLDVSLRHTNQELGWYPWYNVNEGDDYPNDSVRYVDLPLPSGQYTECDLGALELDVTLNRHNAPNTTDNWSMSNVTVFALGGDDESFVGQHGFFRFTGEAPVLRFALTPAGCEGPDSEVEPLPPPAPAPPTVCTPGDEAYCGHLGVCDVNGHACVCYDSHHRYPSERCADWHGQLETPEGAVCSPGDQEFCGWMGECDASGQGCICSDPDHRWSSDSCAEWHAGPEIQPGTLCTPGDRAACSWVGTCNDRGDSCICDSENNWPSENCALWHSAAEPEAGAACTPGDRGYCNWQGTCDSAGMACVCDQPAFYTPGDQCRQWREPVAVVPDGAVCIPGDQQFCHWKGVCNAQGSACECYDPGFSSADRCDTWQG